MKLIAINQDTILPLYIRSFACIRRFIAPSRVKEGMSADDLPLAEMIRIPFDGCGSDLPEHLFYGMRALNSVAVRYGIKYTNPVLLVDEEARLWIDQGKSYMNTVASQLFSRTLLGGIVIINEDQIDNLDWDINQKQRGTA